MANLTFRASLTPTLPEATTLKSTPLTNLELDANFKALNDELSLKANSASPALTGIPTAPTAESGTNTTQIATTAFVKTAIDAVGTVSAPLESPTLSGTPTAPTATLGTNTTQIATTAFVVSQIADSAPSKTGTGASGTWDISISGNAATVTNGVVTSGSYADPAWITSLSGSKVTNAVLTTVSYANPMWITSLAGSKVTNAVLTSGSYADPSWITSLSKSKVGLGNVENTALSTWVGSTNITTVGNVTASSLSTSGDLTVNGTLIVNGTTTTINTNTLSVDDKNIELGSVVGKTNVSGTITTSANTTTITGLANVSGIIPGQTVTKLSGTGSFGTGAKVSSVDSDTQITITATTTNVSGSVVFDIGGATDQTAHLGGITLKGSTDKWFRWDVDASSWSSSESIQLTSTKVFKIAGQEVLSSTTLGGGVTSSSLTTVGTITTGTWNATNIGLGKGGTGSSLTAVAGGAVYSTASGMAITSAGTIGQVLTSNGTLAPSWTTINALPTQTNNSGKYLTTDGTNPSWATISKTTVGLGNVENTALSTWTGANTISTVGTIATGTWQGTDIGLAYGGTNATLTAVAGGAVYSTASGMAITSAGTAGQYLMSNGTNAPTWTTVNALPTQTNNSGKYLTTDGTIASWEPISLGVAVNDDTITNATYYPALSSSNSGQQTIITVSSTNLYFNPSTGALNATIFNSLSDATQKTNVVKIENATETLSKVEGVEFDWNDNGKHSAGVVAQELEKILPFLVETNDNGIKSVNYSGLIAYLVESNKELHKRIQVLENK